MILDGKIVRERIKEELREKITGLSFKPCLAILQVGDREDSNVYIRQKIKFGEEVGVEVRHLKMETCLPTRQGWKPACRTGRDGKIEEEIIQKIQELNADRGAQGIIVQLPLPEELESEKLLKFIKKEKDVDGLVVGSGIISATARAVMDILDYYDILIKGKKVCVIGQGIIAGKPIANELEKKGAVVERCDINTLNVPKIARGSDILVSAVGKAGLITKDFVNQSQIVIDLGINKIDGNVVGDVAFLEVEQIVEALTPVPGGVGPVTVACLFKNLLDLILGFSPS